MKTYDDVTGMGKEGFEAFVASATAMTKGYQAIAQEIAEFSRKAMELNTATFEKAVSARSIERVIEVQQGFAKESYEALVAQNQKLGELYVNAAKEAYKPFENSMASFGVKAPK